MEPKLHSEFSFIKAASEQLFLSYYFLIEQMKTLQITHAIFLI